MDERSEFFRTIPNNCLVIPATHTRDAYESLTLATYHYQTYLTKKTSYQYALKVEREDIDTIQSKTALYDAIYWARDMINMPPRDMNPEGMVEQITQKEWKHFDVHVYDREALKKMGCNLLLAV